MRTCVVTGANRGLGLEFVDQLLQQGNRVFALCRNPDGARGLWELESVYGSERLQLMAFDLTNHEIMQTLIDQFAAADSINLLINNGGVYPDKRSSLADISAKSLRLGFEVNVVGTALLIQALWPKLAMATRPIILNLSSKMGSMSDNSSGGSYGYRVSKAAQNMLSCNLARELTDAIVLAMHPGWVRTEMGGVNGLIDARTSVAGILAFLQQVSPANSGQFFDYTGAQIPW